MEYLRQDKNELPASSLSEPSRTISAELPIEETNPIQIELAVKMGLLFDDWVGNGYSKQFRILINGYDGPYRTEKDTNEAKELRALYRSNREAFCTKIAEELSKPKLH